MRASILRTLRILRNVWASEELSKTAPQVVLVFANKQDLPQAMSAAEVVLNFSN